MLSESIQDYVKQIYLLQQREGKATTSGLATAMDVSAASATAMVKKLDGMGLVSHTPYRGVELTGSGERIALEVLRHHRLLELYLTEALGLSWDQVHVEAERLEHVLSDELEESIDRALGHPATDPHGDPIPTVDLVIAPDHRQRLVDLEPGQAAVVRQVPDGDPSLLRYLGDLGLVPDAGVAMVEKAPFGGPLTVDVSGTRHALGVDLATRIRVEVAA
ncbi:MAG TPA: metal-dependent transcriptional regulator [Gaiellales bacterium]|jgi:DtxR family Mn-dependent transcriptional regulator|nr:metal-dependent transcriptional regulator [Gaiellales bacterium]